MKKSSLSSDGPASQLGRNCHNRSNILKNTSSSLPTETSISVIKSKHFSTQGTEDHGCTAHSTLWFYPCDHGEDTKKWDGKPISTLATGVHDMQGKKAARICSPRKITAPVSVGQSPRGIRRADVIPDPNKETSALHLEELSDGYCDQD